MSNAIEQFFEDEFSSDSSNNIIHQIEVLGQKFVREIEKLLPIIEKDISLNVIIPDIELVVEKEIIDILSPIVAPLIGEIIWDTVVDTVVDTIVTNVNIT